MSWLLLWVHVVALAIWLGETVFFALVVAPALFGGLDAQQAGAAVALIFPGYYLAGYACGALLIATALALWQRSGPGGGVWLAAALVSGAMLAAELIGGLYILPQADALRIQLREASAAPAVREQFDQLHRVAVQLNAAVLIGNLILAGLVASRLSRGVTPRRRLSRYGSDPLL